MIEDGMIERFPRPDVALAQHAMPLPTGRIGYRTGIMLSAGDSLEITLFGRGAHGSAPRRSIDPTLRTGVEAMLAAAGAWLEADR